LGSGFFATPSLLFDGDIESNSDEQTRSGTSEQLRSSSRQGCKLADSLLLFGIGKTSFATSSISYND
jgi:hypothetical protein